MKYEKNRQVFGIDEYKLMKMAKVLIFPAIALILVLIIVLMNRADESKEAAQTEQTSASVAVAEQTSATVSAEQSENISASDGSDSGDSVVKIGETESSAGAAGVDGSGASGSGAGDAGTGTGSEAGDGSGVGVGESVYVGDLTDYGLQSGAPEGVRTLIEKYQKAKIDGDAATMYKLFGRLDTDGLDELQASLDEEKKVFESYQDTTYYSTEGKELDSYLVYVSTYVKFKDIDTPAPMLIWAYCVKGADGDYYMKEPDKLTDEEQALLDAVSASEDVRVLDNSMRTELAKAVVSDPKLAALYEIWAQSSDAD